MQLHSFSFYGHGSSCECYNSSSVLYTNTYLSTIVYRVQEIVEKAQTHAQKIDDDSGKCYRACTFTCRSKEMTPTTKIILTSKNCPLIEAKNKILLM